MLPERMLDLIPYGIISVAILIALVVVQDRYPPAYLYFIDEGSTADNSTVIAFALAAVLLIWESRRAGYALRRWVIIAVAAGAVFIAAEEVSWGQRMFGIGTPEGLRSANVQGELRLHNLAGVDDFPT